MIDAVALRFLAQRNYTREELRRKLLLKGFGMDEIVPVLARLSERGYLNDATAGEYRFQKLIDRGYGPRYVAVRMQQQGLTMPTYPETLQRRVLTKLLGTPAFLGKDIPSRMKALYRRGFDESLIREMCS